MFIFNLQRHVFLSIALGALQKQKILIPCLCINIFKVKY